MLSSNRFGAGKRHLACLGSAGGLKQTKDAFHQNVAPETLFPGAIVSLPVRYLFPSVGVEVPNLVLP